MVSFIPTKKKFYSNELQYQVIKFCWNSFSRKRFLKILFWGICSEQSEGFAFDKAFSWPPLHGCQDEKCVYWNISVGFVHNRIQEWDFVFRDFCCEVNCSVMTICFFEKVCYQLFSSDIPKREDVVWSIYFFHQTGFFLTKVETVKTVSNHKDICESNSDLCSHRCPMCLTIIFSMKLEWVFFLE